MYKGVSILSSKIKTKTYQQLSPSALVQQAVKNNEGSLTNTGALVVHTGKYTGRSPKDKFIVKDETTQSSVHWGNVNQPISQKTFQSLFEKVTNYLETVPTYEFKGFVGSDPEHRISVSVTTQFAWHNLFAQQLFIRPKIEELPTISPEFRVISAPNFKADPKVDGTNSEAFVITNFKEKVVLIGGTEYAGEIKKSLFGVMNFLLPQKKILPMHCGANVGKNEDVALFFGLSGTGKTTLSSDPNRFLIGDDEHGWTENGVFNFEGGCYAKTAGLDPLKEPDIYNAIRFGSVLENVKVNPDGSPDYSDLTLTENTRVAYPIHFISNAKIPSLSGIPKTIFFLTADAFGVLPPISKLTNEQAMFYFLNGYTSKIPGTERGVTEPEITFSSCFGAPFLPLKPFEYSQLLGEKLQKYNVNVYLVNTGWGAGGFTKSKRIKLSYTRKMISSALNGELDHATFVSDHIFSLSYPTDISGVPSTILNPTHGWDDLNEYNEKALHLKKMFDENYQKIKTS